MDPGRHLIIDGGIHSLVDTVTWMSYLHYAAVMDLPKYYVDTPGDMLLLGIGAGSLIKQYASAGWRVDAVDIDPEIVDIAKRYFNLQSSDAAIRVMDAREYLSTTAKRYDVILMDAFGSSAIPFHLVTKEVFASIASHLRPGGVFALNIETIGWNDPIIATVGATMHTAFPDVVAFPIEEPPNQFGNIILMGSATPLQARREPERNELFDPDWRYGPGYQKVHAFDNQFVPSMKNVRPLTDDLNPIELRAETINLAARVQLHKYFEKAGVSW
jgi:spermidine synthase